MEQLDLVKAVALLAQALPWLLETGWKATKEVAKEWGGEATWAGTKVLAKSIWARLTGGQEPDTQLLEAARTVVASPDDPRTRGFLEYHLERVIQAQESRARDLQALLIELAKLPAEAHITQVTIHGSVASGDHSKAGGDGSQIADTVYGPMLQMGPNSTANFNLPLDAGPKPATLQECYLRWLFEQAEHLDLGAIDRKGLAEGKTSKAPLGALYTGLLTSELEPTLEEKGQPRLDRLQERGERRLSALAQLDAHPHLVLLGEAGSGKSTFVQWVTLCLAGAGLKHAEINLEAMRQPIPEDEPREPNDQPERQPWRHASLLPVRVVLRRFAAKGLPPVGEEATADHLWKHIADSLAKATLGEYVPHLKKYLMEKGGLILLDGLDEVPEAGARREQLKQAILGFKAVFGKCRILVTSRVYAYQSQNWVLDHWPVKVLQSFTPAQIRFYVSQWYGQAARQAVLDQDEAQRRAGLLVSTIEQRPNLPQLARQPLLLALMTSLHNWEGGRLPDKREMLYHESVELLLYRWEKSRPPDADETATETEPSLARWLDADRSQVRSALERVAAEVHRGQADPQGTADIPRKDIVEALMVCCPKARGREQELVEYLRDRSGILIEREPTTFAFPHRTFQEYLAACKLANDGIPGELPALVRADLARWREVVLLAGARAFRGSESLLWSLVDALCPEGASENEASPPDFWAAHLAAQAVIETADLAAVQPHLEPKLDRLRRWLVAILVKSDLPALERALAGRHLAALGERREHVTKLDAMEFCYVPPGPFMMGSGADDEMAYDSEKQHRCEMPKGFWMARFPVTTAQWRQYASTPGVEVDPQSLEGDANAPVVLVTWFQAQAFCEWLTTRWQDRLPAGLRVCLPSEAEWEKAARGGLEVSVEPVRATVQSLTPSPPFALRENPQAARRYPWGDTPSPEHANYIDTQIFRPSAVGCFPLGASPYGCEEMSGNVWEWTRSKLEDYPYPAPGKLRSARENIDDSASLRVLRGGAYWLNPRGVRCAYRNGNPPDDRNHDLGFRVVVSPFSSEL